MYKSLAIEIVVGVRDKVDDALIFSATGYFSNTIQTLKQGVIWRKTTYQIKYSEIARSMFLTHVTKYLAIHV